MRPREFLSRAFTGEGEIVIWPYFIGRRLARRFPVVRKATWLSDSAWRFDDEMRLGKGRVHRRQNYCEFVSDDHLRVTAADMPDGADVWLEEGGYRITPWRMYWPIGPIPALLHCRDLSYVAADGTFVNVNEARTPVLKIPLVQMRFYVRPDESQPITEARITAATHGDDRLRRGRSVRSVASRGPR